MKIKESYIKNKKSYISNIGFLLFILLIVISSGENNLFLANSLQSNETSSSTIPNRKASNYELWQLTPGTLIQDTPTILDIENDSINEVIVKSNKGIIYCINASSGSIRWNFTCRTAFNFNPVYADVNNDGIKEIFVPGGNDRIYCLNGTSGELIWDGHSISRIDGPVWRNLVLGDMDQDGKIEILISAHTYLLYCMDAKTGIVEWKQYTEGFPQSELILTNVDDDNTLEIVYVTRENYVVCHEAETGEIKWKTENDKDNLDGMQFKSLSVSKYNDSCDLFISTVKSGIYCLNGTTGILKWYNPLDEKVWNIPKIEDLDMDGIPEIIVATENNTLYSLNTIDGAIKWRINTKMKLSAESLIFRENGTLDTYKILYGTNNNNGTIYCIDGKSGSTIWELSLNNNLTSNIACGYITVDDKLDIIFGCNDYKLYCLNDIVNIQNNKSNFLSTIPTYTLDNILVLSLISITILINKKRIRISKKI